MFKAYDGRMTHSDTIDVVHIHPSDNVAIAARTLKKGETIAVGGRRITLSGDVKQGHKVALADVAPGASVTRYGQRIGQATAAIRPGEWVHTHNLSAGALSQEYEYCTETPPPPAPLVGRTFNGYKRPGGLAGTRNYIAVISSVNCSWHGM